MMNNYTILLILIAIIIVISAIVYYRSNRVTSQNSKNVGRILSELFGNEEEKEKAKDKNKAKWGL